MSDPSIDGPETWLEEHPLSPNTLGAAVFSDSNHLPVATYSGCAECARRLMFDNERRQIGAGLFNRELSLGRCHAETEHVLPGSGRLPDQALFFAYQSCMAHPFLIVLLRCVLALGLVFTPVANALNMSRMATSQEDRLPCHEPAEQHSEPAHASCCASASQCHCAMATCLPADVAIVSSPSPLPDHPQTVRRLTLGLSSLPETPPPRPLP